MDDLAFFRFGRWFHDPDHFLQSRRPPRESRPPWLLKLLARGNFRGRLFHGPNYFLPEKAVSADLRVVTVHDLSVLKYPDTHPAQRVKEFERGFEWSLKLADHIITDSHFVRQELIELVGVPDWKVTAIPLGVSERFRVHPESPDAGSRYGAEAGGYVLCVGTLEPRKGLLQAIDAFRDYRRRSGDTRKLLIVGGAGWRNEQLLRQMESAVAEGWLLYSGYCAEADLPSLYTNAALLLYPSFYEGFGLPPIEAMACGTPVVASNRSCLPEVTKGAAMLVDPEDRGAFACAIEQGLSDDLWRSRAITMGKVVAAGYTWDQCVSSTTDVYRSLMDGEPNFRAP